jgi:hypothetical protein
MEIIRARLKPYGMATEFITIANKIKALILKNQGDTFHFVIDDAGTKTVKEFGEDNINDELVNKTIPVKNSNFSLVFNPDGSINVIDTINESLPRKHTVDQLKKLRKMMKGIDIGDRISDLNKQGNNISYYRNAIDSGVESYEDFENTNKKFIPSWNLKHLKSPFKD